MKLRFIAKAPGRDWKVGDTAEFNDKSSVEMSYAQKYIARGWAEEVTAPAAPKPAEKPAGDKAADGKGDAKQ